VTAVGRAMSRFETMVTVWLSALVTVIVAVDPETERE
jgi:hypothetical protein